MASPSLGSSESQSQPRSRPSSAADRAANNTAASRSDSINPEDVTVEVLVEHLLAAKRSLSSMTLVLRADELETRARKLHEDSVVLSAQTGYIRRAIIDLGQILRRMRGGLGRAYDAAKKDFKQLLRTLDSANGRLEQAITMLRETRVQPGFRPQGEQAKFLMDFVDESTVDQMRDALKKSLEELQAAQTSFDGDMLRFDNDVRALQKALATAPSAPSPSSSSAYQPIPHLLVSLTNNSHKMAEHLTALTRNFDMCVQAVRVTEGGAALARLKAADQGEGGVSISGVIRQQEAHMIEEGGATLETITPEDRADLLAAVVGDAPEVDEVVAEIDAVLRQMEADFGLLSDQAGQIRDTYLTVLATFQTMEDVATRLAGYAAAQAEFEARWEDEKEIIMERVEEMDQLKHIYEGYLGAYDSLILEAERRRNVENKIASTWQKARDAVDKLVEADRKERETFRQEVGDYLPTDIWHGMNLPLKTWQVVQMEQVVGDERAKEGGGGSAANSTGNLRDSKRNIGAASNLGKNAAAARLARKPSGASR